MSGFRPLWRSDGGELYYIAGDGRLMVVEIVLQRGLRAGMPRALFVAGSALSISPLWSMNHAASVRGFLPLQEPHCLDAACYFAVHQNGGPELLSFFIQTLNFESHRSH